MSVRADEQGGPRSTVRRGLALWCALVAVVGAGGIGSRTLGGAWSRFDLDSELTAAAFVSGAALALAGACCLWAASRTVGGAPMVVLGVGLLAMSADEVLRLHEQLESRAQVDWQVLYSPVAVCFLVAFVLVARRRRGERWFLGPWVAGAGFWLLAQTLEAVQWDGAVRRDHYVVLMITEELGELLGTGCFAVAAWALGREVVRRRGSRTAAPGGLPAGPR